MEDEIIKKKAEIFDLDNQMKQLNQIMNQKYQELSLLIQEKQKPKFPQEITPKIDIDKKKFDKIVEVKKVK